MYCITNGIGPDIHQPCAKTTIYSYNGTISSHFYQLTYHKVEYLIIESRKATKEIQFEEKKLHNLQKPIHGPRDAMLLLSQKPAIGQLCEQSSPMITFFSQIQFQPNTTDEIVLMPEGKGMKDATSCMRSEDKNKPAVGKGSLY